MEAEIDLVTAYWTAAEQRDWDAFGAMVAEDVVYEAPQSRERVEGRAAYVRFNRDGFPGDWHVRIVSQPGLCFFEIDGQSRISRITDFWPEPYEPPASRANLVERY